MWLATNAMAALVASLSGDAFAGSTSSSITAGRGTTTIQRRLSTSEMTIAREERRMFGIQNKYGVTWHELQLGTSGDVLLYTWRL
jgi:hypothetical protein